MQLWDCFQWLWSSLLKHPKVELFFHYNWESGFRGCWWHGESYFSRRPTSKVYEAEVSPMHPFSTTWPSLAGIELCSHGTLLSQKFLGEGIGRLIDARIQKLKPLCCHQIHQLQPSVDGFSGHTSFQCTIAHLMNKYDHIVYAFSGMASTLLDETCTLIGTFSPMPGSGWAEFLLAWWLVLGLHLPWWYDINSYLYRGDGILHGKSL